jgi:hypothetical protein
MSLFDNPKTSDYTELDARLIILEKMFKIFMIENIPIIPNTLNTYDAERRLFNDGNDVVFQYFDTGVNVYIRQEDDNSYKHNLFEINKNTSTLLLGSTSHNIGYVEIGGAWLNLFARNTFDFYLDGYYGYKLQFFFTADEITFKNFSSRYFETQNEEVIIPFCVDLLGLEERLTHRKCRNKY